MTIRFATANSGQVKDFDALVSSFEGLLIYNIAGAVNDFRRDWLDVKMTNAEAIRGRVILDPFVFARIVQAFGHKTLKETVDYATTVANSVGALDSTMKLRTRAYRRTAIDPYHVAQYGNAYQLVLCK